MQTREYEGNDKIKRYSTEVILTQYNSTIVLLDSKKDNIDFVVSNNRCSLYILSENTQKNNNKYSKKDALNVNYIPI